MDVWTQFDFDWYRFIVTVSVGASIIAISFLIWWLLKWLAGIMLVIIPMLFGLVAGIAIRHGEEYADINALIIAWTTLVGVGASFGFLIYYNLRKIEKEIRGLDLERKR